MTSIVVDDRKEAQPITAVLQKRGFRASMTVEC